MWLGEQIELFFISIIFFDKKKKKKKPLHVLDWDQSTIEATRKAKNSCRIPLFNIRARSVVWERHHVGGGVGATDG